MGGSIMQKGRNFRRLSKKTNVNFLLLAEISEVTRIQIDSNYTFNIHWSHTLNMIYCMTHLKLF